MGEKSEALVIYHLTFVICHLKTYGFRTNDRWQMSNDK